jgi:Type IV secretion-system coupling protein DNA-binding domain
MLTQSEYFTYQFYTWEYRGRGYSLSDVPILLEPPFIPFYRHGYNPPFIDDGKRSTIFSIIIDLVKGKKEEPQQEEETLDYETLDPYIQEGERNITAIVVKLPKERNISPENMKALLLMLSYTDNSISFEIIGDGNEITIQFVCDTNDSASISAHIKAYFPDCTILQSDTYSEEILLPETETSVIDFGLSEEFIRPLKTSKNFNIDPLTAVLGIFENLSGAERGGIQILFQNAVNKWSESIVRSVTLSDGNSFFLDMPDAPKIAQEKIQSPLFAVSIRVFGQGETGKKAMAVVQRVSLALLNASKGIYNELVPLLSDAYDIDTRVSDVYHRESHRLGMLLNTDELVNLLHFPSEHIQSKKLLGGHRKTIPIPDIAKGKVFVLGNNTHAGMTEPVSVDIDGRMKHTHIIGGTGTGKSTLIANLIVQDIQKGIGIALFDPHGDLVDDVLARIPEERWNDVVLLDAADGEHPIGLNILEAHSELEKEILSSDLVASFRKLSTSWGDQMNSVFGNAIVAMLESSKGGTLHDLRRFLVETSYRETFLQSVSDPSVQYYWRKEYPLLKTNSIGPILTRLDTFLRPKTIRNMVVQKTGLDFEQLVNTNKIILIKLSQGLIGTENSYLLGSLILSKIHQAALARQKLTSRNPFFIYLDEFQNFITPSIKEMLSGVRKYNVGLILSHQDLQQLQREDTELLNSILSNTYTRIVFRVGETDAKRLQDGFSDFDFTDLQNLGRGEAVVRIEQPKYNCSLDTSPLMNVSDEQKHLVITTITNHSRTTYGKEKALVEQELAVTLNMPQIAERVTPKPVISKVEKKVEPERKEVPPVVEIPKPVVKEIEENTSTHRYLQVLVKKMAEARGYTATIEKQLTDGTGLVDVLLTREGKTLAVEICNTTDPEWEMHNIQKCIDANYDTIVSFSGNSKQLEKIRKKCVTGITDFETKNVMFLTPDALFAYLDTTVQEVAPKEQVIKGYRVNVSYTNLSPDEMEQKRKSVASVVLGAMGRKGK